MAVRRQLRKVRKPAGAGRKPVSRRPTQALRQSDAIIIPGITGPIIPEAEAAAMGSTVFVTAAKSIYRLKSYFGGGGKLTAKQLAAYEKKQRQMKRTGGEWEYKSREQTGLEKNFGDVPTNMFYSRRLGKKVALTGEEAPGRTKTYPGAPRDWIGTQMIQISGPAEAGAGGMKTKVMKIIKGKNLDKKGKPKPIELALWNWGDQIPRAGAYKNLTEKVGGMGRFQQSYVSGRYTPKKGEIVSKEMLPPGVGMQTEYVALFDQPGLAPILAQGIVSGKTQIRKSVTKGKGTGKPSFKSRIPPVRIDDILKRSPTGKTKAVLKSGKFKTKQTKTGRYSLSTKKPFRRSADYGTLDGGIPAANLLDETKLDKVFAKAVRGKHEFTKTLNLGVWRKLNIKQKSEVLKAAGVA